MSNLHAKWDTCPSSLATPRIAHRQDRAMVNYLGHKRRAVLGTLGEAATLCISACEYVLLQDTRMGGTGWLPLYNLAGHFASHMRLMPGVVRKGP
jgi:hypothetical protein